MTDHAISLDDAIEMTQRYRENRTTILASAYQSTYVLPLSETFDKAALTDILNNVDCSYIRIYYGMDADLNVHAVLVGANADNEDILPVTNPSEPSELISEQGRRCPVFCPPESVLNQDS